MESKRRRAHADPNIKNLVAYLQELLRRGLLTQEHVRLAAGLGQRHARVLFGNEECDFDRAFSSLPSNDKRLLACDAAQRVFWVYEDQRSDSAVRRAISITRDHVAGRASSKDCQQAAERAREAWFDISKHLFRGSQDPQQLACSAASRVAFVAFSAASNATYKYDQASRACTFDFALGAVELAVQAGLTLPEHFSSIPRSSAKQARAMEEQWQNQRLVWYLWKTRDPIFFQSC